MKVAFWTVTRGAGNIARGFSNELKEFFGRTETDVVDVYSLKKFEVENTLQMEDFTTTLSNQFSNYDAHIFIMASGIVIRKISSLLKSKDVDPAILIIDEGKHFVISLLSGHLGGANELAYDVAKILNLVPVITTSSDITGKIAVDTIAQKLNAELKDLKSAKEVTSLIVDGKEVNILLPKNVKFSKDANSDGIILVSNRKEIKISKIIPKNIVVGIGCKKGTKAKDIIEAIEVSLEKNNIEWEAVKHIATVDVKKDEEGLVKAVNFLELELKIIQRDEIKKIEHLFEGSDFVEKNIGVRAVSEPVAFLSSSQRGKFITKKERYNGITISIFEEELDNE